MNKDLEGALTAHCLTITESLRRDWGFVTRDKGHCINEFAFDYPCSTWML